MHTLTALEFFWPKKKNSSFQKCDNEKSLHPVGCKFFLINLTEFFKIELFLVEKQRVLSIIV